MVVSLGLSTVASGKNRGVDRDEEIVGGVTGVGPTIRLSRYHYPLGTE